MQLRGILSCTKHAEDGFLILAGRTYHENLLPHLPHSWLPLRGKRLGEWAPALQDLLVLEKEENKSVILHSLFRALPRYRWEDIPEIPFENGIYVMFERGEEYQGQERITRVGTHRSQGRLKGRLTDHFCREDKNGSIFRKNIGRALLRESRPSYLPVWEVDTRIAANKEKVLHRMDQGLEKRIEKQITRFLQENISFTCFPVDTEVQRLRLEDGIIATLHREPAFSPGPDWFGKKSPVTDIVRSGQWNRMGLDEKPLTEEELQHIKWLCRFGASKAGRGTDGKLAGRSLPRGGRTPTQEDIGAARRVTPSNENAESVGTPAGLRMDCSALEGRTLLTLTGKPFRVASVHPGQSITVIPQSTGKPRPIQWEELEKSRQYLERSGRLTVGEIRLCGASDANPSYVFTILSHVCPHTKKVGSILRWDGKEKE